MEIHSNASFQGCSCFSSYIQSSDLSTLTSVYGMRWTNNVFDELVIRTVNQFTLFKSC